ncbi:tetratricopeptide repeat protein [uncultured Flavobacterium sp.]|uniref:tetratricopeptide repeat protein n=1 Tax=uncultured Flavobacterium sp. TaxID=165435 RepID=UPI0030820211
MNVTDYTYLMNKPDAITEKQTDALGSVLNEFPYFQSARALRLKGLYDQNSFKYNYALKVTAAHTCDRSVLFDFITSETFTSIQSEYYDQKLKHLLNITVFDSEIISAEQSKKMPEVRIDPIEKSILNSIKEATSVTFEKPVIIEEPTLDSFKEVSTTFEEPKKTEEPIIESISEQAILDSFKDVSTLTFEKAIKTEEPKIELIDEQAILDSFKEVTNITFEEPAKIEEPIIESISEQAILDSFKAVATLSFEESAKIEEQKVDSIVEQPILTSDKEETNITFEEPVKIEEQKVDSIIEQPILTSDKEETNITFEEPAKIEEQKVEPIIEQPVLTSDKEEPNITFQEPVKIEEQKVEPIIEQPVKIATSTFFDETVDDEISEVQIDPIEKSILNPIQETSTTFFEKAVEIEEPKEIEIPETVKDAEENLEIGKPLDFSVNEKHSFQEWLQLAKTEPIDRTEEVPEEEKKTEKKTEQPTEIKADDEELDEEKKKKAEIIDKFIETNPKISPIKQTAITPAVQFNINQEDNSYLMTETLARVYLEQKKYTKAIQAYEILILKYPEKISFFADRISDIKILQQNNNNN